MRTCSACVLGQTLSLRVTFHPTMKTSGIWSRLVMRIFVAGSGARVARSLQFIPSLEFDKGLNPCIPLKNSDFGSKRSGLVKIWFWCLDPKSRWVTQSASWLVKGRVLQKLRVRDSRIWVFSEWIYRPDEFPKQCLKFYTNNHLIDLTSVSYVLVVFPKISRPSFLHSNFAHTLSLIFLNVQSSHVPPKNLTQFPLRSRWNHWIVNPNSFNSPELESLKFGSLDRM